MLEIYYKINAVFNAVCTYWNDSVVFQESAESESSGRGMKSWYLSFQVFEAVEEMEGFLTGEAARPGVRP